MSLDCFGDTNKKLSWSASNRWQFKSGIWLVLIKSYFGVIRSSKDERSLVSYREGNEYRCCFLFDYWMACDVFLDVMIGSPKNFFYALAISISSSGGGVIPNRFLIIS